MEGFCGIVFCLNVSASFLIAVTSAAPMDANGDNVSGLDIDSFRSSAALVYVY